MAALAKRLETARTRSAKLRVITANQYAKGLLEAHYVAQAAMGKTPQGEVNEAQP